MTILIEKKNYKGRAVIFDSIARLSEEGEILDKWSTFDHLDEIKKYHYTSRLETPLSFWDKLIHKIPAELEEYDYYHINSVQEIPKNALGEIDNRFQEGNLLVSLHSVNIIIILDKDSKKIVWSLKPDLIIGTHMPTMLETGNILIFDNGDEMQRSYSRVLELNPITEEVVWRYIGTPPESFYTESRGSAQRLPNGNTLITESDKGHVFEVTPDKEIVWEYYIPYFDEEGRRQVIYRTLMVDKNKIDSLLKIWE